MTESSSTTNNTKQVLVCAQCSRQLSTSADILDDTYFVYGKPAYLLKDADLTECKRSATEKRSMRSGTYDIDWLTCGCGLQLGFVYIKVYEDSYSFKVGKSVVVQSSLERRSVPIPPNETPSSTTESSSPMASAPATTQPTASTQPSQASPATPSLTDPTSGAAAVRPAANSRGGGGDDLDGEYVFIEDGEAPSAAATSVAGKPASGPAAATSAGAATQVPREQEPEEVSLGVLIFD